MPAAIPEVVDERSRRAGQAVEPTQHWWGDHRIVVGESRHWRIGGLDLFVARRADGWMVQSFEHPYDDAEEPPLVIARAIDWIPEHTPSDVVHYKGPRLGDDLTLAPLLADRPVVSRPRMPFNVTAGATVTVYVGTPLWVGLRVGDVHLCELPLMRPPQTWFGASTFEGELCYAGRTHCRTTAADVPRRPWRAISPLRLENRGRDGWQLDRVALPVPQLSLYAADDGRLWTAGLTATRNEEGEVEDIRIGSRAPVDGGPWTELGRPRRSGSTSILGRFYGKLF